jgi:hypothetical protein
MNIVTIQQGYVLILFSWHYRMKPSAVRSGDRRDHKMISFFLSICLGNSYQKITLKWVQESAGFIKHKARSLLHCHW